MDPASSGICTESGTKSPAEEKWYRVEGKRYAVSDEYGDHYFFTDVRLICTAYRVAKHTPKGVRLETGRFVGNNFKKQWASPTVKDALKHFQERRKAEIRILESKLSIARDALKKAIEAETESPF